MSQVSLLRPMGYQRKTSCGYCKNSTGTSSYYMQCDNMRVEHYQYLVDRGWRRSGKLYYKPDLSRSCCPHYTIRLKASEFKPTREQRKAVHRFNNHVLGSEYKRKAAMLRPVPREMKRQKRDKFDLTEATHASDYGTIERPVSRKSGGPIEPAHKFEVSLEGDSFSKEKYEVFFRYQRQIHKDPASRWPESAFKRFLCDGLHQSTLKISGKTKRLGSYHHCYRLDGKLVAVGVLDLLPHAVSSVYLFYDPDFSHFDWGKLGALREITLTIEAGYEHYYMGFYIHSCLKMRYKAGFNPSYLLDPETYEWNEFDKEYQQKLDKRKYVSPSHDLQNPPKDTGQSEAGPSKLLLEEETHKDSTKSRAAVLADNQDFELDEEDSETEDAEIPEGSLFDYNIPGVLSKSKVSDLNLGHWKLVVRNTLVDLEDLRGWEEWKIDDPDTIRGIAAELIASTGPGMLDNSALVLF